METEILWGKARASYLKNDLEGAINMYSRAVEYGGKEISANLIDEYLSLLIENNQNLKAADTIKSLTTNQEKPYIYLWGSFPPYSTALEYIFIAPSKSFFR